MSFKRYRITCDERTRSTTKMDIMILFEQAKADFKNAEMEENLVKKVEKSISDFKLKSSDNEMYLRVDSNLSEWFEDNKPK